MSIYVCLVLDWPSNFPVSGQMNKGWAQRRGLGTPRRSARTTGKKSYIRADIQNEAWLKFQGFINANIFSLVKSTSHFEAFGVIGLPYKAKSKRGANGYGFPHNDGSESGGNFFSILVRTVCSSFQSNKRWGLRNHRYQAMTTQATCGWHQVKGGFFQTADTLMNR